jgi:hypothetical protein
MGYSLAEPESMPPLPLPDSFTLEHFMDATTCFIDGRLVIDQHTVVMELYQDHRPLSENVPARLLLGTTAKAPGLVLKKLVPAEWRTPPKMPGWDEKLPLTTSAGTAFDEMERRRDRVWYFLAPRQRLALALVSAHRDDPKLTPLLKFNRRSLRPMVTRIAIVQSDGATGAQPL